MVKNVNKATPVNGDLIGQGMTQIGSNQIFLATTALEEFWDVSKPMVFLGDGCRRYSRRSFWEPLGAAVVPSCWADHAKASEAYDDVNALYERLLPALSEAMNRVHGVNHGVRWWRIVLGPWLFWYLSVLYDRYSALRSATTHYPDFTTLGLSEESFVTPGDTREFVCSVNTDAYNLQLYTRILAVMGRKFPRKRREPSANPFFIREKRFGKSSMKEMVKNLLKFLEYLGDRGRPVTLKCHSFPRWAYLRLMLKSGGAIWPNSAKRMVPPCLPRNDELRGMLGKLGALAESEFEAVALEVLPLEIPLCFLEGFGLVQESVKRHYASLPKVIFSAYGWYFDEDFKAWAAAASEKGTVLMGAQHGGNYGVLKWLFPEQHEVTIADRFYSWGWDSSRHGAKIVTFAATKLIGRKVLPASNQKKGVLFVTTVAPRHLFQFPFTPDRSIKYLAWQRRFMGALPHDELNLLRVRPHNEDYGWDVVQRWSDEFPDVQLERWNVTFLKSLEECRLFVCDHISTTYTETLAANKPTILFWNAEPNELRAEAQPYFDLLRREGILYDSPEAAAEAVTRVYGDVEGWWNEPARQAAVKEFCHRFARTSLAAVDDWARELGRWA